VLASGAYCTRPKIEFDANR